MTTWLVGADLSSLLVQLGAGGLLGFIVGYAVKKLLKVLLVILGLGILMLMLLNYVGIVTVDWDRVVAIISSITPKIINIAGPVQQLVNALPFAGAFVAGFILGIKVG